MVKTTYTSAGTKRCLRVVVHGFRRCSLGAAMSQVHTGSWLERAPQKTASNCRKLDLNQRGRWGHPRSRNEDAGFSSMNGSHICSVVDNVVSVVVDMLFVACRNENQADGLNRIWAFAMGQASHHLLISREQLSRFAGPWLRRCRHLSTCSFDHTHSLSFPYEALL